MPPPPINYRRIIYVYVPSYYFSIVKGFLYPHTLYTAGPPRLFQRRGPVSSLQVHHRGPKIAQAAETVLEARNTQAANSPLSPLLLPLESRRGVILQGLRRLKRLPVQEARRRVQDMQLTDHGTQPTKLPPKMAAGSVMLSLVHQLVEILVGGPGRVGVRMLTVREPVELILDQGNPQSPLKRDRKLVVTVVLGRRGRERRARSMARIRNRRVELQNCGVLVEAPSQSPAFLGNQVSCDTLLRS